MSDLRKSLEELESSLATSGEPDLVEVATKIASLLAAHPDETGTEWGVRYVSGVGGYTYDSYAEAAAVAFRGVGAIVISRQVTPWKAAS